MKNALYRFTSYCILFILVFSLPAHADDVNVILHTPQAETEAVAFAQGCLADSFALAPEELQPMEHSVKAFALDDGSALWVIEYYPNENDKYVVEFQLPSRTLELCALYRDGMMKYTRTTVAGQSSVVAPGNTISQVGAFAIAWEEMKNRYGLEEASYPAFSFSGFEKEDHSAFEVTVARLDNPPANQELFSFVIDAKSGLVLSDDSKTNTLNKELDESALSDDEYIAAAWHAMKDVYGFEDVVFPYMNASKKNEDDCVTVTFSSNKINPQIIGNYTITLSTDDKQPVASSWNLEQEYQKQGRSDFWSHALLWSAYEYTCFAKLRLAAKELLGEAQDSWYLSFEKKAAYDALYRDADYDRSYYYHGTPTINCSWKKPL
ncbi:MAG: hypothetical protein PHI98_14000 [Eubacteriales bacterium]|nr:hypothetical protein [Eubacteriales bacterium]